jgi:hypothetical protein
VAANVCDDLHVCNGGSADKDHLNDEAVAGTQIVVTLVFVSWEFFVVRSWYFSEQVSPTKQACCMRNWNSCLYRGLVVAVLLVRPEGLPSETETGGRRCLSVVFTQGDYTVGRNQTPRRP